MQELDSIKLLTCIKEILMKEKLNAEQTIIKPENVACHSRKVKSVGEELYKRLILPFYTLIISLIAASLVIEPKSKYLLKFHKLNIFLSGISVIILSQLVLKFVFSSINIMFLILFLPIFLIIIYYAVISILTKFKLSYL